jgi:hypothetical protein
LLKVLFFIEMCKGIWNFCLVGFHEAGEVVPDYQEGTGGGDQELDSLQTCKGCFFFGGVWVCEKGVIKVES